MRINKFIALATGVSRRDADDLITAQRVHINGIPATSGDKTNDLDEITLDGRILKLPTTATILLNKPVGYIVSRDGQGSKTVYDLLPEEFYHLKPIGRLDKDSSGLLLLTNDGELAHRLTHPSFEKSKVYEVSLDKPLNKGDFETITKTGVDIGDGRPSRFRLAASGKQLAASDETIGKDPCYFLPATRDWQATLSEGRNRQIRRTFAALGYTVTKLHRTKFGPYTLERLKPGSFTEVSTIYNIDI